MPDFLLNSFFGLHYVLIFVQLVGLLYGLYLLFIGPTPLRWRQIRWVVIITSLAYLGSFNLSWVLYPFFAPELRENILDPALPMATAFFSIKDHLIGLGAILAGMLVTLSLIGRIEASSIVRKQLYGSLFATLALVSIVQVIVAFLINVAK